MTIKRKFDKLPPYCQFEKNINLLKNKWTELSNKVLTQRLKELENNKIIEKRVEDNETSYYLTERGERLRNIIYELAIFNIEESGYGEEEIEKIKKELCQLKEDKEK